MVTTPPSQNCREVEQHYCYYYCYYYYYYTEAQKPVNWQLLLWPPCVADADIIFSSCGFFTSSIFFLA